MQRSIYFRVMFGVMLLSVITLLAVSISTSSAASSPALRRYPYLTDLVGSYATINWGTDRSETSGAVRFGKVGSESCTAHYVSATKTGVTVNGVLQYQWKALLDLRPGTQYCYRVYLGSSPLNEVDLLGSDPAPSFWTQVPSGATQPFSFVVFGDWGQVDASGTNSYQASLMSLMASSGALFAVTTGDNGYPDGNQKNLGDLLQTGLDTSAIFGPSFWRVPGASLPIFPILGNHGYYSPDTNHPQLITWPQDRAVSTSGGRYAKETYCCLDGTFSQIYPSAWYAFDAGPARFYLLHAAWDEVNIGTASEHQVDYDYHWAPGTAQYDWLQADLAAHPSVLKFAFFHYPLYSDNPQESTDTFLLGSSSLEGLLKQHGVDIAFTGHAHIYERNLPSPDGIYNYITGGGGATLGTLGTCTALDAYAIKFTTTGKACGSAPVPTSAGQVYHFLKVTVSGTNVTVTPINSLGQAFDVLTYDFSEGAESTAPTMPTNLNASAVGGRQINLSWSASSDDTGVRGYGIYRNGTLVGTVNQNTLSYSDTDLLPSTDYSYTVDAFDGSGNHSALSASESATTQNTATYTFTAVADAYVAGDFTTTNYGNLATLKADASPDYHSYLRFNVDDLSGAVTNVTLRLYPTSSSATGYQVRRVTDQSWEEGSIVYDNAPAVGSVIGSSGNFASGNWISVDVTSFVTGDGVYDLALTTTTAANMNFNSRDAGSNKPQLVIQTFTPGAEDTTVTVSIGGTTPSSYLLHPNESTRQSFPGVNAGPVKFQSSGGKKIMAAERVIYNVNGVPTSFSEMMALPNSQLDTIYWLPWYNNVDLDTQLRFGNVSGSTATIHVFIGVTEMNGSPFTLASGDSIRKSFAGVNNGPVKITSNVNIVAAERVIYNVNNAPTSFSEMMALPNSELDTTYWLPWYNNVDLDTQLRFGNVSASTATVHVFIGDVEVSGSPFTLTSGQSTRQSFTGVNNGPVKIVSNVPIVAAERVIYKINNAPTSFSEMMALPESQLDTTYWLPWYNNVDLDTQLGFGNVSGSTATVHVFIGGSEVSGSPFTLTSGQSTRQSFAGVNNGPVKIVSNVDIVAAERVIYKINNLPISFSEMMALSDSQLDTMYWLPWYNNIDLDTQLRFGMP